MGLQPPIENPGLQPRQQGADLTMNTPYFGHPYCGYPYYGYTYYGYTYYGYTCYGYTCYGR